MPMAASLDDCCSEVAASLRSSCTCMIGEYSTRIWTPQTAAARTRLRLQNARSLHAALARTLVPLARLGMQLVLKVAEPRGVRDVRQLVPIAAPPTQRTKSYAQRTRSYAQRTRSLCSEHEISMLDRRDLKLDRRGLMLNGRGTYPAPPVDGTSSIHRSPSLVRRSTSSIYHSIM